MHAPALAQPKKRPPLFDIREIHPTLGLLVVAVNGYWGDAVVAVVSALLLRNFATALTSITTPGFVIIADCTGMKGFTPDGARLLRDLMVAAQERGCRQAIEIVPDEFRAELVNVTGATTFREQFATLLDAYLRLRLVLPNTRTWDASPLLRDLAATHAATTRRASTRILATH